MQEQTRLTKEIYPGIYQLRLPMAGKEPGPVNVYLFKGKNNTLLDCGTKGTVNILEKSLAEQGISFADLDNIVLTHGHPDHYGAASKIKKKSGVCVKVHADDKKMVENGLEISRRHVIKLLKIMGVPLYLRMATWITDVLFRQMADNCKVDQLIQENDEILLGNYTGKVFSTPGHSKGSICIFLENEDLLFAGDHILKHITPNAFAMVEPGSLLPVRSSQAEFKSSLKKIEDLAPKLIFPGHGEIIDNLSEVTDMYQSQFARRQKAIMKVLSSKELTVYEIVRSIFPHLKGIKFLFELILCVSEVYTHLQVLQAKSKAKVDLKKGNLLFSAVY